MHIREACQKWMDTFHEIPMGVITKLREPDGEINEFEFQNVTPKYVGQIVNVYDDMGSMVGSGEILECNSDEYKILMEEKPERNDIRIINEANLNIEDDDWPMWGTMWAFKDSSDIHWLEKEDGIEKMAKCGFMIFKQEDYDYVFGINGAGYTFFNAHFLPLYCARGLNWHDEPVSRKDFNGFGLGSCFFGYEFVEEVCERGKKL